MCFHDEQGRICEIPLSWTNLAAEDPFVIFSAAKSWFRFEDLLEASPPDSGGAGIMCKDNFAASEKEKTPRKAHKLTPEVLQYVGQIRSEQPSLGPAQLATAIQERLGITVHPRSIERALARQEKNDAESKAVCSG